MIDNRTVHDSSDGLTKTKPSNADKIVTAGVRAPSPSNKQAAIIDTILTNCL
ncbi:unnamed protein product, partial [Rotaria magnacalcarata]